MAGKTPEERALADVEKAIKAHDTANEKAETAKAKYDELASKAKRSERELRWVASHPELPEDFDLDAFRQSLAAPFDDDPRSALSESERAALAEDEKIVAEGRAELAGEDDPYQEAADDAKAAPAEVADDDTSSLELEPEEAPAVAPAEIGDADGDDDPWAGEG